ncbi:mechanosensitive ion channel [bacterium]|nr:mechanosensitive ion channel [bacterium]
MHIPRYILIVLSLIATFAGVKTTSANSAFQDNTIRIATIGSDSLKVVPGKTATIIYSIESAADQTVTPTFDVPTGWNVVTGSAEVVLKKSAPTVRIVVFSISKTALSDSYSLNLVLSSKEGSEIASHTSSVFVNKVYALSFESDALEGYAPAGMSVKPVFHLSNQGNTPITVVLSAKNREFLQIELSKAPVSILPGETKQIEALINSDANIDHTIKAGLRFEARVLEDDSMVQFKTLSYEVIPVYSRVKPIAAAVPLSLSFETVGDENGASPQARIAGAFEALGGNISVSATLSEQPREKMFGSDRYLAVHYKRDDVMVKLGDHSANLSPLTIASEQGIGAAVEVASGEWTVKTTAQRTRHSFPVQERLGVSVSKSLSETSFASVNLLHRKGLYDGTIVTARSVFQPFGPTTRVDLECGIDSGKALQDPSCSAMWTQSGSKWSIRLKGQKASKSFPGTVAGVTQFSEFSSYRLNQNFRLDNSLNILSRNLGDGFSRTNRFLKSGITYSNRIKQGTLHASVHGIQSRTGYESLVEQVTRSEIIVRSTAGYQKRNYGVTLSYELGSANSDNEGRGTFTRFKSSVRKTLRSSINLNASYEHSAGNLTALDLEQSQSMYGLGTSFAMPRGVSVSATAFISSIKTSFEQQYTSLRTRISKTFRSGHLLSAQAQFNRSEGRIAVRSADYSISYSLPMSLPFGEDEAEATLLRGTVVDQVTGQPVPNVVIFLADNISITDKQGRFAVPRKLDRSEYLRLDQKSIGYNRIPTTVFPLEITPEDYRGHELVIPIGPSATLTGYINIFSTVNGSDEMLGAAATDLELVGGVSGAVVQISNETHRIRTRTDRNGKFQFGQLPEGTYKVEVIKAQLKDYQRLKTSSSNVILEAEAQEELVFEVVPFRKQLRIIKSSSLSIENELPATPAQPKRNSAAIAGVKPSDTVGSPKESRSQKPEAVLEENGTNLNDQEAAKPANGISSGSWLDQLKESAKQESIASRKGGVTIPFYVNVRPRPPKPDNSTPVYFGMLILSVFFFLVAIELVIRNIIELNRPVVRSIAKPTWIWAYRQSTVYAALVLGICFYFGPLGGLAIALGLAGVSVIIETSDQYRNIGAILYLLLTKNVKVGSWIAYQEGIGQVIKLTLQSATISLMNGQTVEISPRDLIHVSASEWKPKHVQKEQFSVVFSRLSDLRSIRHVATEVMAHFAASGMRNHVTIEFSDIDSEWTSMLLEAVVDGNIATKSKIEEKLIHELKVNGVTLRSAVALILTETPQSDSVQPQKEYPSLRLVKLNNDEAA